MRSSTDRAYNAMVHNPIYDGPVYDSVQPHFDSLTEATMSTLSDQACNNSSHQSTTSDFLNNSLTTARYVQQSSQASNLRSKSFSFGCTHTHPSAPPSDVTNTTSQSTSDCMQAKFKRSGEDQNELHLTLPTDLHDSDHIIGPGVPGEVGSTVNESHIPILVSACMSMNPAAEQSESDVDEKYTLMSPIGKTNEPLIGGLSEY